MKNPKLIVIILFLISAGILRAIESHNIRGEWDEDDYMIPAAEFRRTLEDQNWDGITNINQNREHPVLVKFLYGLTIDTEELEEFPTTIQRFERHRIPEDSLQRARWQSVLAGTATVGLLAIVNPLAGILLSLNSIHLHFTSVAYLDAVPVLMTLLMALFYQRGKLWWSALCFGAGVAAKYPYAIVGVALLGHALFYRHYSVRRLFMWGLLSISIFTVLMPYLWPAPIDRLENQFTYHQDYAQSRSEEYRFDKPLTFLANSRRYMLSYHIVAPRAINTILLIVALIGIIPLLKTRSFYGWWLVIGLIFLMLWRSQWIQHTMTIIVPYTVSMAAGLKWIKNQLSFIGKNE